MDESYERLLRRGYTPISRAALDGRPSDWNHTIAVPLVVVFVGKAFEATEVPTAKLAQFFAQLPREAT
jgi:hypothetical protein